MDSLRNFLNLLYLDKSFISGAYEAHTGKYAETKITSSDTLHAEAKIPLFSGGASSVESKTYSISTLGMLEELRETLNSFEKFTPEGFDLGNRSKHVRFNGLMTVEKMVRSRSRKDPKTKIRNTEVISEEVYFAVESESGYFALICNDDYFSPGFDRVRNLSETIVEAIEVPVDVVARVIAAKTIGGSKGRNQWIAIPFVISEST